MTSFRGPWGSQTRTVVSPLRSAVVTGRALLDLLSGEHDLLAQRCDATATARGPWLTATVLAARGQNPWALTVRDSDDILRACIVVLEADDEGLAVITLAGSAMGFRSSFLADSASASALLGHSFAEMLRARDRDIRVELGPVDDDTPWLADFVATVGGAEAVPTDPIPSVRRLGGTDLHEYLGSSMLRTLRKAANRAATDHRHICVRITGDSDEILDLLSEVERVHRERDHTQGRPSDLDSVVARGIWRARLMALMAEHTLELATLHIDGDLAAHVLAIVEPPGYRVLEGNLATRWVRYAPGRVLEAAVLRRALEEPSIDFLDWMSSVASEALLVANDEQPVSVVRAYFGAPVAP